MQRPPISEAAVAIPKALSGRGVRFLVDRRKKSP
jgi:hypothetical protein